MTTDIGKLVDWPSFHECRAQLGGGFVRILGYFEEDGTKSVADIESAMSARSAVALVDPAHRLKGESLQFGATALGAAAEHIEMTARRCVEQRIEPTELAMEVAKLRDLFERTLALLQREAAPVVETRRVFGQRTFGMQQRFG